MPAPLHRITDEDLAKLRADAAASPRLRAHRTLHASHADSVQRMVVAVHRGSYIRPHRHAGRFELITMLKGALDVLLFDDDGVVTERFRVGADGPIRVFELPGDVWHGWSLVSDEVAFLEAKPGPYDPATAAEFAPWAPAEGTDAAVAFLPRLDAARPGTKLGVP